MAGFSVPTYAVSAKYTAKTMEGAGASYNGGASNYNASDAYGVRPAFAIK